MVQKLVSLQKLRKIFGDEEPSNAGSALMLGFSKEDATSFVFEEVGKTKGGAIFVSGS